MIRFAVVGTGWITSSFVASAHASGEWQLTAVYSRKEDTARHFGSKHNATKFYTSLSALATDDSIQAVYIASPNSFHYEQAKLMLEAGKHVVLEKPATSTLAELDNLFKVAKEKKVFLIEANRHLQETNFKILKKSMEKLGPIYGASLTFGQYSSRYTAVLNGETPNIFSLAYSGGALVDLGVYPISAAVELFGKPKAQTYIPVIISTGADGGGMILLTYDGFGVNINASKIYNSTAPSEIYGQNGTLIANGIADIEKVDYLNARTKERTKLARPKQHLNLLEEAQEFARIIKQEDWEEARRLESVSKITLGITMDLRKQCGLVFDVEKEKGV